MSVRKSLVQARFSVGDDLDRLSVEVRPGIRLSASGFAPIAEQLSRSTMVAWRVAYSLLHVAYDECGYSLAERIEAIERARTKRAEAEVDASVLIAAVRKAA